MRLSEARIEFIAKQAAEALKKKKMVAYYDRRRKLSSIIAGVIVKDLRFEDKIDQEVIKRIKSRKREIPEGSAEWNAIYDEEKQQLLKKYDYKS